MLNGSHWENSRTEMETAVRRKSCFRNDVMELGDLVELV
jgi:hypothetical protein